MNEHFAVREVIARDVAGSSPCSPAMWRWCVAGKNVFFGAASFAGNISNTVTPSVTCRLDSATQRKAAGSDALAVLARE